MPKGKSREPAPAPRSLLLPESPSEPAPICPGWASASPLSRRVPRQPVPACPVRVSRSLPGLRRRFQQILRGPAWPSSRNILYSRMRSGAPSSLSKVGHRAVFAARYSQALSVSEPMGGSVLLSRMAVKRRPWGGVTQAMRLGEMCGIGVQRYRGKQVKEALKALSTRLTPSTLPNQGEPMFSVGMTGAEQTVALVDASVTAEESKPDVTMGQPTASQPCAGLTGTGRCVNASAMVKSRQSWADMPEGARSVLLPSGPSLST